MRIPDWLAARIRTVWPMLVGFLAARLLVLGSPLATWLHNAVGLDVTQAQVAMVLGVVLGWAVYEAGRWLERRAGDARWARIARGTGRLILSIGLPTGQPVYAQAGQRVRVVGADGTLYTPR